MKSSMTFNETADFICAIGSEVTTIVEGHIGSGKSSLIDTISERFPNHRKMYLDMTVMHEGDFRVPAVDHATKSSEFYPNASLGMHDNTPVVLMLDEMGKATKPVKDASLPLLVERRLGNQRLHPDSIVFATTNLGAESVGDTFQAHHRNRMSFVQMKKPTAQEWVDNWARFNDIAPEVIMWVGERPDVLHSFEDYKEPNDNPFIFHPRAQRTAFVTHRSLAQASKIVNKRHLYTPNALESALVGTVGAPAALDMQAWIAMGDSLPKRTEIINDPENARMPKEVAGKLMLAYQALNWVDEQTLDPWMDYMARMPREMQALFCTSIIKKPAKQFTLENDKFTTFAIDNQYMFA
jgi:hypothetical protein